MTDRKTAPDLNALLAQEQTAIMVAETTRDDGVRERQREIAHQARDLANLTPFPWREPHDFDRLPPAQSSGSDEPDDFIAEFETLKQAVEAMDRELGVQLSEGTIGTKHNTYQHRSRLVRQARGRLNILREASIGILRLYPNRIDTI